MGRSGPSLKWRPQKRFPQRGIHLIFTWRFLPILKTTCQLEFLMLLTSLRSYLSEWLLLATVQAGTVYDGLIKEANLVEGGQLVFLNRQGE